MRFARRRPKHDKGCEQDDEEADHYSAPKRPSATALAGLRLGKPVELFISP
jgi:hypothetical protein